MRTAELFPKPRRPARVLMHPDDVGNTGAELMARFRCRRCGHHDWYICSATEIRRGIPCPGCNADTSTVEHP